MSEAVASGTMLELTPVQRAFVDALYRKIDHEPQVLLEHDAGPPSVPCDLVVARLIGGDDELVNEMLLREPLAVLRTPEPVRDWSISDEPAYEPLRVAEWVPQSVYATGVLDALHAGGWPLDPATMRCRVLALRYRLARR